MMRKAAKDANDEKSCKGQEEMRNAAKDAAKDEKGCDNKDTVILRAPRFLTKVGKSARKSARALGALRHSGSRCLGGEPETGRYQSLVGRGCIFSKLRRV